MNWLQLVVEKLLKVGHLAELKGFSVLQKFISYEVSNSLGW